MSQNPKCPKCGGPEIATYGLFASCCSEDCSWIGPVSRISSREVIEKSMVGGLSSFMERSLSSSISAQTIQEFINGAQKRGGANIDYDSLAESDKSGSIQVHTKKSSVFFPSLKAKLLMIAQNSFFYGPDYPTVDDYLNNKKNNTLNKIVSLGSGENKYVYHDYGFPPFSLEHVSDGAGLKEIRWDLINVDSLIWQPIDWKNALSGKNTQVHYLAVLQIDGQNFTYFANEDLDNRTWTAGISQREYMSATPTVKLSTSATVEEAAEKLKKHYDKTFNGLTEGGDPIEVGWSKEFGYEDNLFHVCDAVRNSDIFIDDCTNEMIYLCGKNRRELYEEVYENSLNPVE